MAATFNKSTGSVRLKSSRLSLKNQKKLQDISPAPVPRSSHRIRTSSTDSDDKSKIASPRRSLSSSSFSNNDQHEGSKIEASIFNGLSVSGRASGICPLANLGNTCFLNSVLYALRFLPGFVHDLHHLQLHLKSSSVLEDKTLTQRINFLNALHKVFCLLKEEEKTSGELKRIPALHPILLLESIRNLNPVFEGNRQQDAHELLHCLLDMLLNLPQDIMKSSSNQEDMPEVTKSPRAKRRKKADKMQSNFEESIEEYDVVDSKFVGQMVLETRCVECEQTNSQKENFLEVCVPVKKKKDIDDDEEISDMDVWLSALCKEEGLVGNNKYWCDFCCHHNEAERFVHFQQLPQNLLIHIKRFSSYARTLAGKCCDTMPAPFELPCFCQECLKQQKKRDEWEATTQDGEVKNNSDASDLFPIPHLPYSLRAFVCHLGATISSGHYISFVHITNNTFSSCLNKQNNSSCSTTDCSFMSCCSSHFDRVVPSMPMTNGFSREDGSQLSTNGAWLECDDEKIKVVSHSDVTDAMKSNILTPYLIFYSR